MRHNAVVIPGVPAPAEIFLELTVFFCSDISRNSLRRYTTAGHYHQCYYEDCLFHHFI